jgi:hypothetical protein
VGNLIRRVASAALAQHASRFLAETENEVVAP